MAIQSFANPVVERFFSEGRLSKNVGWANVARVAAGNSTCCQMRAIPRRRQPTTPGEILREEFLIPLGMTQKQLADHLACDVKVVNRIVNGRTSVTAEMALKLGATFRTTPEFWLNAQTAVDVHHAARHLSRLPKPLLRAS